LPLELNFGDTGSGTIRGEVGIPSLSLVINFVSTAKGEITKVQKQKTKNK